MNKTTAPKKPTTRLVHRLAVLAGAVSALAATIIGLWSMLP